MYKTWIYAQAFVYLDLYVIQQQKQLLRELKKNRLDETALLNTQTLKTNV